MSAKPNRKLTTEQENLLLQINPLRQHKEHFPDHGRRWLAKEKRRIKAERGLCGIPTAIDTEPVPGYAIKGTSTLYDANGNVTAQWVKTRKEDESLQALLDQIPNLCKPHKAKPAKAKPRRSRGHAKGILTAYPMGDPHFGLYAWAKASGVDFDLETAERNLIDAVDHLVELAPKSETALIANLGDFLNADGFDGKTSRGTPQDNAALWPQVLQCGVRALRRAIDRALEKHKRVRLVNAIGNHDGQSSLMLSAILAEAYRGNRRVQIETSPRMYNYHRFGKNLIGMTHGDKSKPDALGQIMAADEPEQWGETLHRYWYIGHVHHDTVKEVPGVRVESFRTLAPASRWSHGAGYRSGRDMKAIVLDRDHGEILRHTVGVGML